MPSTLENSKFKQVNFILFITSFYIVSLMITSADKLGVDDMNFISASYNMYHNGIDITIFDGYILRIDCNKAETGLKTTP